MTIAQEVHLNQITWKIPPVIHAVQNDTGRDLTMIIDDHTLPSGSTATLSIERADGTHYDINTAFVQAQNAFMTRITQALTCPGETKCQLKVDGIVSTYTFIIDVQHDTGGVVSPQEGISLVTAVQRAEDAADRAEAAAASSSGMTNEAKDALLACLEKVAWVDEHGQDYLDALEEALFPEYEVSYNLTNVESSNDDTSATRSYTTTLSASNGFLSQVEVTMDGVDITNQVFTPSE